MEEEKRENAQEPEEQKPPEEISAPKAEEPKAEEPKAEEPKAEEPKEEPKKEEEKVEEKAPESVAEEKAEEPVVEEKKEEEKAPEPVVEEKKEEEKEEEEVVEPAKKIDRKWYVIQTLTGQEDKVKQAIDRTIENQKLKDKLFQVLVPTEETVEIKGGKRVEKIRKMFPGYVFLEMVLDDESWFTIRNTPWVARFIGTKIRPTPVSDREMQRVLKQLGKGEKLLEVTFEKGEAVRVISGPFRGYTGTVDEVNADKGKMKVLINIFGRDTPVEVNFEHAQRLV
jgi:transcriptional antiterminator NusG